MLEPDHPLFQPKEVRSELEPELTTDPEFTRITDREYLTQLLAKCWYNKIQLTTHGVHEDGGRFLHIRPDQAVATRSPYSGAKQLSTLALCGNNSEGYLSYGLIPDRLWELKVLQKELKPPHICKQCLERFTYNPR